MYDLASQFRLHEPPLGVIGRLGAAMADAAGLAPSVIFPLVIGSVVIRLSSAMNAVNGLLRN